MLRPEYMWFDGETEPKACRLETITVPLNPQPTAAHTPYTTTEAYTASAVRGLAGGLSDEKAEDPQQM